MRDIITLVFMMGLAPLVIRSAFASLLMWSWANLSALGFYMYGFMAGVPYVMVFAVSTLVLMMTQRKQIVGRWELGGAQVLFLMFSLHALFVASFAYPGIERNWEIATNLLKNILLCLLMPLLVVNRARLVAMVIIMALGLGGHGVVEGLKFLASGGAHIVLGNPKLGDNNHFAQSVLLSVPLAFYLWQYSKTRPWRYALLGFMFLVAMAVIATKSRGGLIGFVCFGVWMVLMGRQKFKGLLIFAAIGLAIYAAAPASWFERMETLQSANEDASFMGRVTAWKRASAIAVENPVFGGGFRAVQAPVIFEQFRYKQGLLGFVETPNVNYPAAAHSIYFEVLGDMGFVGLLIFVALMWTTFSARSEVQGLVRKSGRDDLLWAADMVNALAGAMFIFLITGAALSAAFYDFHYMLVALADCVRRHVREQVKPRKSTAMLRP